MREDLELIGDAVRSVAPLLVSALKRGQLLRPSCELFEPDPDVMCEYDVRVPVSDGLRLTANVFRSRRADKGGERVPVIMCAHPYDNRLIPALGTTPLGGPPQQYRFIPQAGRPRFSTLTSWESPDPDFWVRAGYAVVNLNLPGFASSEGPPSMFSEHQARCFHDAIEHIASRPWCTGAVGLSGVSFLAISQYYVAAGAGHGKPPSALRAISPWEGISNPYRDVMAPGGVVDRGFAAMWWFTEVLPVLAGEPADFIETEGARPPELLRLHRLYDDFWRAKVPELHKIELPMLVCASFSDHNLHTVGSFRAFTQAASENKWVYTHRTGKWDAYYSPEVLELTRRFMDRFVKGEENGFEDTPAVRLEVRRSGSVIQEVRGESAWPLANTRHEQLYLDGEALTAEPGEASQSSFDARRGSLRFVHRMARDTELTGYFRVRLWLELQGDPGEDAPDDVALCVYLRKLDRHGAVVAFRGTVGSVNDGVARGYLQASLRELDEEASTPHWPVLACTRRQPLTVGEVVALDIGILPSSTWFDEGDSLELIVAGHEVIASPPFRKDLSGNRGRVVVHQGGELASHLVVPNTTR